MKVSDYDRIREALTYIPSDDRDTWLKIGMAIKSELGDDGFSLWDYWSQSADSYKESDARSVWRSIKNGSTGIGTLFHLAKQHGWKQGNLPNPLPEIKHKPAPKHTGDTKKYALELWLGADC